jgi:hypothetical protein
VDSALSSIFNQIDSATAGATKPDKEASEEETAMIIDAAINQLEVLPPPPVVSQQQLRTELRRPPPHLQRQASAPRASPLKKTVGTKQNGSAVSVAAVASGGGAQHQQTNDPAEVLAVVSPTKRTGPAEVTKVSTRRAKSQENLYINDAKNPNDAKDTKDTKDPKDTGASKDVKDLNDAGHSAGWRNSYLSNGGGGQRIKDGRTGGEAGDRAYSAAGLLAERTKVRERMDEHLKIICCLQSIYHCGT